MAKWNFDSYTQLLILAITKLVDHNVSKYFLQAKILVII